MERYYIVLLDSFVDEMDALSDEEYGSLIRAGQRYAMTGEVSDVVGNAKFYLRRMISVVDYYTAKLEDTNTKRIAFDQNADRGKGKGKGKRKIKENKIKYNDKEREEKSGVPPSLVEVEEFCEANGLRVNAALFHSYYQARGWKLNGQPIDDWKATVQTWALRERGTPSPAPEQTVTTAPDAAEVERMRRLREQLQKDNKR